MSEPGKGPSPFLGKGASFLTWLTFLLGLWVFISGFVPGAVQSNAHCLVFGAAVAVSSFWTAFRKPFQWVNFVLGLWFAASGFFLHNLWNNLAVGLIVAVLALIDGVSEKPGPTATP